MPTCFLKDGNTYHVTTTEALSYCDTLPAQNFVVKFHPVKGFYLEEIPAFTLPGKLYGSCDDDTTRVLKTFQDRQRTTGLLLSGEKGGGKSLFAKVVSVKAHAQGMPTVAVTSPFVGEQFDTFLQTIEQPCVVIFDEFEKVYDDDKQQQILSLLDGVFNSNKLFIFTCNDSWRVSAHMHNRPGRVFYYLKFRGVAEPFIREYCADRLIDQAQTNTVCTVATMFEDFNFDMLQALVEEMNRYAENAHDALRMLNVKPQDEEKTTFDLQLFVNGQPIYDDDEGIWRGNPLRDEIRVNYYADVKDTSAFTTARFLTADLKKLDTQHGEYTFENAKQERVVLRRQRPKFMDYRTLLA